MRCALVDDDKSFHNSFKDALNKQNFKIELDYYIDGNTFIHSLSRCHFDIVFLDIEMPERDGLQVAEYLHRNGYESLVVYVTNRSDAVLSAYGLNVIGFIEKRNIDRQLHAVIDRIQNEFNMNDYFSFMKSMNEAVRIKKNSIALIEKSGRRIILYTTNNQKYIIRNQTLQQLKESLNSESFAYADRSVIVNLKAVSKVSKTLIYIKNHPDPVYISKYRHKEFMQLLMKEMKL